MNKNKQEIVFVSSRELEFKMHSSKSYCEDKVYYSYSPYKHAIDIEIKTMTRKNEDRIFSKKDMEIMNFHGHSSVDLWMIKECIIKFFNLRLLEVMKNDFVVFDADILDERSPLVVKYDNCLLYPFKFRSNERFEGWILSMCPNIDVVFITE